MALAVLLLAAGTAGCTQDGPDTEVTAPTFAEASPEPSASPVEPSVSPSVSPSAEPSVEPTVAAPALPDLATQQTPEGAVAFTQWWFETLNYATATGDTVGLRAASDPACVFCANLATQVETAYEDGGRMQGGGTSVVISPPGALLERGINLAVIANLAETSVVDSAGAGIQTYAGNPSVALVVSVLTSGDAWTMGEVSE